MGEHKVLEKEKGKRRTRGGGGIISLLSPSLFEALLHIKVRVHSYLPKCIVPMFVQLTSDIIRTIISLLMDPIDKQVLHVLT